MIYFVLFTIGVTYNSFAQISVLPGTKLSIKEGTIVTLAHAPDEQLVVTKNAEVERSNEAPFNLDEENQNSEKQTEVVVNSKTDDEKTVIKTCPQSSTEYLPQVCFEHVAVPTVTLKLNKKANLYLIHNHLTFSPRSVRLFSIEQSRFYDADLMQLDAARAPPRSYLLSKPI